MKLPERTGHLEWFPAVRLVGADWPPVVEIEAARTPAELDGAMVLIGRTDPARRSMARAWEALPVPDRRYGPGASDAMTPYLFAAPGRFSDIGAGAFYAAESIDTALAEALHHRARAFARSGAGLSRARFRHLHTDLSLSVTDVRGRRAASPGLYDPADAGTPATREHAASMRADGSHGIAYDSLRRPAGQCVAVFHARDIGVPVVTVGIIERDWHPSSGWLS